jgi:DNA-binding NarL/FixJ family response regulator
MPKIILVDDHKIVRDCVRALLKKNPEFEIVGEADNGLELQKLLPVTPVDVVLMDINMSVMDGVEATHFLKKQYPQVKVLAFSMLSDSAYAQDIVRAGASGFISKTANTEELVEALRIVAAGKLFINPVKDENHNEVTTNIDSKTGNLTPPITLSKREKEVLMLVADGLNNEEIADRLFNSKRTIETHRQNILMKTQCKNTPALIKYALVNNLIP